MNMKTSKRWVILMLALVLALTAAGTAMAAEVTGQHTLENVYSAELNPISNVLALRYRDENGYRLVSADGQAITEPIYLDVDGLKGYFEVQAEEGLNKRGVIDAAGAQLMPCEYADIDYLSDRWLIGVVLEESTAENYDYTAFGGGYYLVTRYDVYYQGAKVGEMGRMDLKSASAYGDYLYVRPREGDAVYYDRAMTPSGYEGGSASYEYDDRGSEGVFHMGSGQQAFTEGCTLTSAEVCCDRLLKNGALYDLQGNIVAHVEAESVSFEGDGTYGRIRKDGLYGLIDRDGQVILPCEYAFIATGSDDRFFPGGYQLLEKDGKVAFADAQGRLTCDFVYAESALERSTSPYATIRDVDGSVIVLSGAVGELATRYADVAYNGQGTPLILVENSEDQSSVLSLTGDVLVPFMDRSLSYVSASVDGTVVLVNEGDRRYTVYQIDPSVSAEEVAAAQAAGEAPAEDDAQAMAYCPNCGTKLPEEVPNFCPNCGQKLK